MQPARFPCPSPTPGACSKLCPSSQWYHPTISSSVIPFSSCPRPFPASGSFPMGSSYQVTKVLELQHQSFQWTFRFNFLSNWLVWSHCCPRDSQESSPAPQLESINSLVLRHQIFMIQLSHPYMATGKTHKIQTLPVQEVKILPQEWPTGSPSAANPWHLSYFWA